MPASPTPSTIVICVDHGAVTGGQSKVAIESALGLRAADARVIFFCATGPVDPRLAAAGVETQCLDQHDILSNPSRGAAAVQGLWNGAAASALGALLARLPRDAIVHVHGWAKALSPAIAAPIRASGLPAVYTMHEYFLHCPNGGFYNYQTNRICPLTPMSAACWARHCDSRNYAFKLWRNARLLVAQKIAHLAEAFDDFIFVSPLQDRLLAPYYMPGAAIHHVCNPVEAEPLGAKTNPAQGDILFAGRLSPEKGALLFAQAAARAGVTPVFIGDGPIADDLRARFPDARFLGWRAPQEVRAAMRAARAFVFPSLWVEAQGLTAMEAMAMGTPVIVSDVTAARDYVPDGVAGLWFRSGDVDALAQALESIKDDALATRLAQGAYDNFWRQPPTLARHVEEALTVYRAALARRARAAA
jgi:glycosyltransferase involved in cell wall biosynthesis